MISSEEIRNVTFSNSMAGYKKDEVDIFLDKIEVDIEKYETITRKQEEKIEQLEAQISELKESQNTIQNVLLNAQKLADKIVEDAKSESAKIVNDAQNNIAQMTEKSKLIAGELDAKATEKKERLESELAGIIKEAENKKGLIETATEKAVKNQQELFNRLKKEMSDFRKEITEKYKEHLKLLSTIPEYVDVDPEASAKAVSEAYKEERIEDINKENLVEEEPEEVPECNASPENARERYKVALMVPLYLYEAEGSSMTPERKNKARPLAFLQFYEGFKMAAEQLTQRSGLHLDLTVIDVTDNVSTATSALSQIQGKELDMIIGPFFGKSFEIIEEYAKEQNILVVNPLSTREIIIEGNPNVVKAKAGPTGQIVNLVNLVKRQYRDANVFIVSQELEADTAFLNALEYRLNQAVNAEVTVSNEELLHYAREESERKEMAKRW